MKGCEVKISDHMFFKMKSSYAQVSTESKTLIFVFAACKHLHGQCI